MEGARNAVTDIKTIIIFPELDEFKTSYLQSHRRGRLISNCHQATTVLTVSQNGKLLGHVSIASIWVNLPQLIKIERKLEEKKVKSNHFLQQQKLTISLRSRAKLFWIGEKAKLLSMKISATFAANRWH